MDAAMKTMSTFLVDVEKQVTTIEARKELLKSPTTELLSFATRNGSKRVRTRNGIIVAIPPTSLGFALHVEKAIVAYSCRACLGLLPFTSELQ